VRLIIVLLLCLTELALGQTSGGSSSGKKSEGSALGNFIKAINNAGKSLSAATTKIDSGLQQTSKSLTKFSNAVEGYAPDSMRTKKDTMKMKKPVTPIPVKPKTKADSTKRKSVFEDVFKEN
jgi:hypothetical protein